MFLTDADKSNWIGCCPKCRGNLYTFLPSVQEARKANGIATASDDQARCDQCDYVEATDISAIERMEAIYNDEHNNETLTTGD